jgi:hypothetical protein
MCASHPLLLERKTCPSARASTTANGVAMLLQLLVIASVLAAAPVGAQDQPGRIAIDLSAGFGRTFGRGPRDVPEAFALGAVIAGPAQRRSTGAIMLGVSAQAHWPLDFGTSCIVLPPSSACIPTYPQFSSVAALAGWKTGRLDRGRDLRVLLGPAVFRATARGRVFRPGEVQTLLGFHGRIDVTAISTRHVGLVFFAQGATTSPLRADRYVMLMGGAGIRLR